MSLRDLFLLDAGVVFLNHGSFGACPRAVFAVYQEWQRRLERQPVQFLGVEFAEHMGAARTALGAYLGAEADNLVYIPNATYGVNMIARSLSLQPGDEILTSNHEYGACDRAWRFVCLKSGAIYRRQPIDFPASTADETLEQLWQGVNQRTRLIFVSHITSPTALTLPVAEICARARQAGILTLIDGAHAPGQIPLDVGAIGADFYTGNCHKWMMAPKGAAFLHARQEVQATVEPLVVSWGWNPEQPGSLKLPGCSELPGRLEWHGTDDPSACLAVPAAIEFMQEHQWDRVRQECHHLLSRSLERLNDLSGLPTVYPCPEGYYHQMAVAELPQPADLKALKARLYKEYHIEVPLIDWNGRKFVRISVQGYNTQQDLDALYLGLQRLLPQVS
jgi:isopenicillin-N epimerase